MKLKVGMPAPTFEFEDILGKGFSITQHKGHKIYLSFFRNVTCPFCNLRAYQMIKMVPRLKDKIKMVFIFESKKGYLMNSSFTEDLKHIQVLSDPEKELYHLYGAESSILKTLSSALSAKYHQQLKSFKDLNIEVNKEDKESDKNQIPADFLIDEEGKLAVVHYGKNVTDRLDEEVIVKYAENNETINA